jgi:tryptophan synthase beta chain
MCRPRTRRRSKLSSFCTKVEGIIPALEPAHALAHVTKLAPTMERDQIIVMNLCGRGDKDVFTVGKILGFEL